MASRLYQVRQWAEAGNYQVMVHAFEEDVIDLPSPWVGRREGATPPPSTRVCFIDVEYANPTIDQALSCRRNQWFLYDTAGYNYEAEPSGEQWYRARGRPFLGGERLLNPGQRLRGWLAFRVPAEATISRAQFLTGFLNSHVADVALDVPATPAPEPAASAPEPVAQPDLPGPPERHEQELITIAHSWLGALVRHDIALLEQLLAPEFRAVSAQGLLIERAAYLRQARAGMLPPHGAVILDLDVQLTGATALVLGLVEERHSDGGEEAERLTRLLLAYRWQDGRWLLMFAQATYVI